MNRTNDQKSATSPGRVDLIRSSILASPPWLFAFAAHLMAVIYRWLCSALASITRDSSEPSRPRVRNVQTGRASSQV